MLENIGEQPVNTLENQQIMDARIAERTLLEFHKDGQVKGWSWNSEFDYQFNRDSTTKQIKVPESVVRFSMDPYDYAGRFQLRGQSCTTAKTGQRCWVMTFPTCTRTSSSCCPGMKRLRRTTDG